MTTTELNNWKILADKIDRNPKTRQVHGIYRIPMFLKLLIKKLSPTP